MSDRLGTARWESQPDIPGKYPFAIGKFWLGRSEDGAAIGYRDDRHICLVSGNRGGKGTSLIVNNLCFWPGSAVVVDPKGENAAVTAARRGRGDRFCEGMGQAVHVLDPFKAAQVDETYQSCFNPLDALDPEKEETIDEASRLANAIVVVKDETADPFWDESARAMVRGLILHVLTASEFTPQERNLITIRNLISRGEWRIQKATQEKGLPPKPPHQLLWQAMECNPAFDGIVAGIGTRFLSMMTTSAKTFEGVLQAVANHTDFLDSPGMRRVLARSDFKLSELKRRMEGMTLYLSLPQRYMDTHYRWLRMMVALTTSEMEITRGQPASGHPVLMVLDEFAGLKRMTSIENAVAQIAGFGVKLFFVLQSLEQLKYTYKDNWETFLANAGVKIFFSIEDHFTREYVSKLAGEAEIIREVQSSNKSEAESESLAEGRSQSDTRSQSTTIGKSRSVALSHTNSVNRSFNRSKAEAVNNSQTLTRGQGGGTRSPFLFMKPRHYRENWTLADAKTTGFTLSITEGIGEGTSSSWGRSETVGESFSETVGTSETTGTSQTYTEGTSRTKGTGRSETVHRRPLIQPDEVGRYFARIDDKNNPAYPGLALVLATGANPLGIRRTQYFDDPQFIDCFGPHPDHKFEPPVSRKIEGLPRYIRALEQCMEYDMAPDALRIITGNRNLSVSQWFVQPGTVTWSGQPVLRIDGVPPDSRSAYVFMPYPGKVFRIANGDARTSEELLTLKTYENLDAGIDPFIELRQACADAMEKLTKKPPPPPTPTTKTGSSVSLSIGAGQRSDKTVLVIAAAILIVIALVIATVRWNTPAPVPEDSKISPLTDQPGTAAASWGSLGSSELKSKPAVLDVSCDIGCTWTLNGQTHGSVGSGSVARVDIKGTPQVRVEASAEGLPALPPETKTLGVHPGEKLQVQFEFAPALRDLRMRVDTLMQEGDQHRTSGDDLPAALRAYRQAQRISPDAEKRQEASDKENKVEHECRLENIPCGE